MTLVHDLLLDSARRRPEAEALVAGGRRLSYGDLLRDVQALAAGFRERGVLPGDRVGILTDGPIDYVTTYFAGLVAGAIVVGLNTQTTARRLQQEVADCAISVLVVDSKYGASLGQIEGAVPSLRLLVVRGANPVGGYDRLDLAAILREGARSNGSAAARRPSDVAQIIYTSGATGRPKGVMLSHSGLLANCRSIVEYLGLRERDRGMVVLPFFYSYGNSVLLTHVAVGATLVVNQSLLYPNVVVQQMVEERVTGLSGVPSTFALLLRRSSLAERPPPDLRYVTQAGGPMAPALVRELVEALPGRRVFLMYGQTEASARLSFLDPKEVLTRVGSIGKAIPGVTLRVASPSGEDVAHGQVGELVARGENLMTGYWGQPEASAAVLRGGELWTGDLATMDRDGFVTLVGRTSEMIKSGAHRIAPKAIEDVLMEHSAVHEAAVIGVEDAILGQSIEAHVVLERPAACGEPELLRHCRRLLPAYSIPHRVVFREALPRTESGKVKKGELRPRSEADPARG